MLLIILSLLVTVWNAVSSGVYSVFFHLLASPVALYRYLCSSIQSWSLPSLFELIQIITSSFLFLVILRLCLSAFFLTLSYHLCMKFTPSSEKEKAPHASTSLEVDEHSIITRINGLIESRNRRRLAAFRKEQEEKHHHHQQQQHHYQQQHYQQQQQEQPQPHDFHSQSTLPLTHTSTNELCISEPSSAAGSSSTSLTATSVSSWLLNVSSSHVTSVANSPPAHFFSPSWVGPLRRSLIQLLSKREQYAFFISVFVFLVLLSRPLPVSMLLDWVWGTTDCSFALITFGYLKALRIKWQLEEEEENRREAEWKTYVKQKQAQMNQALASDIDTMASATSTSTSTPMFTSHHQKSRFSSIFSPQNVLLDHPIQTGLKMLVADLLVFPSDQTPLLSSHATNHPLAREIHQRKYLLTVSARTMAVLRLVMSTLKCWIPLRFLVWLLVSADDISPYLVAARDASIPLLSQPSWSVFLQYTWSERGYLLLWSFLMCLILYVLLSAAGDCIVGYIGLFSNLQMLDIWDVPVLSRDPNEFWSRRWNRTVRFFLRAIVFIPSQYHLRWNKSQAAISTFFFSAVFHEYLLRACPGTLFLAVTQFENTCFFVLHGAAIAALVLFRRYKHHLTAKQHGEPNKHILYKLVTIHVPTPAQVLLTITWFVFTAIVFFAPYYRSGVLVGLKQMLFL